MHLIARHQVSEIFRSGISFLYIQIRRNETGFFFSEVNKYHKIILFISFSIFVLYPLVLSSFHHFWFDSKFQTIGNSMRTPAVFVANEILEVWFIHFFFFSEYWENRFFFPSNSIYFMVIGKTNISNVNPAKGPKEEWTKWNDSVTELFVTRASWISWDYCYFLGIASNSSKSYAEETVAGNSIAAVTVVGNYR